MFLCRLILFILMLVVPAVPCFCWGFYGHERINFFAVFLLPPEMLVFYKRHIDFLTQHSVDPDKRRYAVKEEAPRHYIDMDRYGKYPFDGLPRRWDSAVKKLGVDSLNAHGIVPWWVQVMERRLEEAMRLRDAGRILKLSAELGHYIADAHVPLHASSNHNGQHTGQRGIHGFWESRIPELLAEKEWDFFIGGAAYIKDPLKYIWARVLESAAASDTVLRYEKELSRAYGPDKRYAFEERSGKVIRQYSKGYTIAYDRKLNGMVERRMRQSIYSVASFWYTAWVNAGQPELRTLGAPSFSPEDQRLFDTLNQRTFAPHSTPYFTPCDT